MTIEEMKPVVVEPAVEETEPVVVEAVAEETTPPARPARSKNKGKQQAEWRQEADLQAVTALFLACARCSYFLAGYQLIFNDLAAAVSQSEDNWIILSWSKAVRLLLHNSYGCLIDIDLLHYAGHCRECQRLFVYQFSEEETPRQILRVQLRPR